jgi:hypothetical protein
MNTTPDPEAPKLDPQPFTLASPGVFGVRSATLPHPHRDGEMGWEWTFAPRREYSQNRKDYLNA